MTLKEIKKAVSTALKTKYPDMKVYGADTVEGYDRPSFFVYVLQTFSEKTMNGTHKNVEIEIDFIQKSPDESEAMDFFTAMEELFQYKLQVGYRKLTTDNMNCTFEGAYKSIPVCTFDVEFWDRIKRATDEALIKEINVKQEIKEAE